MATCKDCLHCEACTSMLEAMGYTVDGAGLDADKRCNTFKQRAGVIIALTMEQWEIVRHWLQYGTDYHRAKVKEWLAVCDDKQMGGRIAAQHEKAAAEAEAVHKIIEEAINEENKETAER